MEYEYAISSRKPVIAFLHAEPGKIQADKTDPDNHDKLKSFRDLVRSKVCKFWTTPQDLGSVVSRSVVKLIKDKPGVGWVRADLVPDESAAREILRLRSENDNLKRMLEQFKTEPPRGSEIFAFGDEETQLNFSFEVPNRSDMKESISASWNELFAVLAPLMIDGASEIALKGKLNEYFRNRKFDQSDITIYRAHVRDEDFQRVKVQFRALGLIAKDDRERVKEDATTRRILTPYGDTMLTHVAAVRSSRDASVWQ